MDINNTDIESNQHNSNNIVGNFVDVRFVTLGDSSIKGKVDTGATTSSLHAENIKVDRERNNVSFLCKEISNNVLTMELDGAQEVVSADAGGTMRPIVTFDVEINGVPIKAASFNLNDRSEMNCPLLIGQNILKAGHFVIDVNKDDGEHPEECPESVDRDAKVHEAIQVLAENNVTLSEIMQHLRTAAVNSIKE